MSDFNKKYPTDPHHLWSDDALNIRDQNPTQSEQNKKTLKSKSNVNTFLLIINCFIYIKPDTKDWNEITLN